ncbi:MAG TPA: rRNA maturation RNase YbeY [Woeseiaceae bacterium]|jgi:probable rRNA maturation factor|nr:rRNA maturation RNase YbeY [Woeseiaceae bacterium]
MVSVTADIHVACDAEGIPSTALIREWISAAVRGAGVASDADIEVGVRVVSADEMRELNRQYREQGKATNVLSFDAGDIAGLPAGMPRFLGDVVICAAVVADEARQQGKPLEAHWAHMLVHGTLHLLGHDHVTDAEAETMEALETRILAAGKVADPYRRS